MKTAPVTLKEGDRARPCFPRIDSTIGDKHGALWTDDKVTGFLRRDTRQLIQRNAAPAPPGDKGWGLSAHRPPKTPL